MRSFPTARKGQLRIPERAAFFAMDLECSAGNDASECSNDRTELAVVVGASAPHPSQTGSVFEFNFVIYGRRNYIAAASVQ